MYGRPAGAPVHGPSLCYAGNWPILLFFFSMKTLFLDLASHSDLPQEGACIACVTDATTEAMEYVDHRIGDDELFPLINSVMGKAGWTEKDLTQVACVTGPGGFTSLRMAVTLANTYADLLGIKVAGVRLDEVYEWRVTGDGLRVTSDEESMKISKTSNQQPATRNFIWIHATKKTALFVRGFGDYQTLWPEPVLLSLEDLVAQYPEGAGFAGELLAEQRALLEPKGLKNMALAPLDAILPSFLACQTFGDDRLEPWYGRGW